jgi:hypothetical protein
MHLRSELDAVGRAYALHSPLLHSSNAIAADIQLDQRPRYATAADIQLDLLSEGIPGMHIGILGDISSTWVGTYVHLGRNAATIWAS